MIKVLNIIRDKYFQFSTYYASRLLCTGTRFNNWTKVCSCRNWIYTSFHVHVYYQYSQWRKRLIELQKRIQPPLLPISLRWSTLQNNGCSTYPLTDHLMTVILHPVCITAHNCLFKSATTAVTIAIILISSQLRVHSFRTSKLCDNNMHIMQWEDELLLRTNANDCLHIWLNR